MKTKSIHICKTYLLHGFTYIIIVPVSRINKQVSMIQNYRNTQTALYLINKQVSWIQHSHYTPHRDPRSAMTAERLGQWTPQSRC